MKAFTGKTIDTFVNGLDKSPVYWGDKFDWSANNQKYTKKVNGAFMAKKYDAILKLINETKAVVTVLPDVIEISYKNGMAKIYRDKLVDTYLIPSLTN